MKNISKVACVDFRNHTFELELQGNICYINLTTEFAKAYKQLEIPIDILFSTCTRAVFPELPAADMGGFPLRVYWRTPLGECPYVDEAKRKMVGEFAIDVKVDTWVLLKYTTTPKDEMQYKDILLITTSEASKIVSFISESRTT